ncbi:transcriptional regulatory protein moc3 [Chaetomidium leptoderma]|uniref:Transcriptional regulatory protein moc3 n=1 Tax=Chaetomidium leptoderma TaxID=669021 RepID=A0AAN7A1N3_9PEZI|nr:transcriptional regulatory protein moc3 [Chaetomidium leptoderma]
MAELSSSNRSSVEPSSNPSSPSPSPAGGPSGPPKKRTRASKPKVRTGCITWIRRVKCDEGKPACVRCTSTGRTCDGYDKAALARYRSPDPNHTAELARAEFVRACESNESLRSMRRIEADIDGTETERRLFARFRAATADGGAHGCPFTAFWRRLNSTTGCQDEAVKHAVVALAAAYQLFRYPNEPVIDIFTRADLEVFTIQQYNRSIERLQSHAGSSASEGIRLTLVCCLAFISLETLRGNHEVAVTHLVNGLRILQSLPDSTFDCLADSSIFAWPSNRDSLHMPDIIQLFAQLELSACFFTHGIQPVLSERGYRTRRFDDGSRDGPFSDATHARMSMSRFQHDVMARLHELAAVAAGGGTDATALFWSDPTQHRQQSCLLARSARLGALTADFLSPSRFGGTTTTTTATPSDTSNLYLLNLLYFHCTQFLLLTQNNNTEPSPDHHHHLLPSIIHLASRLFTTTTAPKTKTTNLHTPLLGPLFLVATHTSDPTTQATAMGLLTEGVLEVVGEEEEVRVRLVIERVIFDYRHDDDDDRRRRGRAGGGGGGGGDLPRALTGVGCVPLLWDALASSGVDIGVVGRG